MIDNPMSNPKGVLPKVIIRKLDIDETYRTPQI